MALGVLVSKDSRHKRQLHVEWRAYGIGSATRNCVTILTRAIADELWVVLVQKPKRPIVQRETCDTKHKTRPAVRAEPGKHSARTQYGHVVSVEDTVAKPD